METRPSRFVLFVVRRSTFAFEKCKIVPGVSQLEEIMPSEQIDGDVMNARERTLGSVRVKCQLTKR